MTIYYVSKTNGNDSNAGTVHGAPKLTIQNACQVADGGSGNIVEIIDSLVYHEGDFDVLGNAITLRATGTNTPIMDGGPTNRDYAFKTNVSGNKIIGITFRDYDNGIVNGYNTTAYNFTLSGCIAHYIVGPQQIGVSDAGMADIRECKIVCDQRGAFTINNNNPYVLFQNSVIASNAPGYPVIDSDQARTKITASFCTFIGSCHNNSNGRNYNILNQVYTVINCIVSGTGDGINAKESTYNLVNVTGDPFITWSNDDYDGTPRAAATGEKTGAPAFVSGSETGLASASRYGNADFQTGSGQNYDIQAGSSAAGFGIAYNDVTLDLNDHTRPGTPSIGAYEGIITYYGSYGVPGTTRFLGDYSINLALSKLTEEYKRRDPSNDVGASVPQPPFSLATRGVLFRGRPKPYLTSLGGKDPDDVVDDDT